MNVAVIPARGGSKRIPRKNIRLFHGKPIIAYSILSAIESQCFDRIVVSTDDPEIAEISKDYGAEVPFLRTPDISDDHTGTNRVVADALERLSENERLPENYQFACCIYATAPFVTAEVITKGLALLKNSPIDTDYAVTVTSFAFPIQRACRLDAASQYLSFSEPQNRMVRSQDLEEMYHDAGQVYWGRSSAFLNDKALFENNTLANYVDRHKVQDIDTEEDWLRAEIMYEALQTLEQL